jgi:hypothetical protein
VGRFVGTTSEAQLQLTDLRTRLAASGAYQPLAHAGWSQTASSWGSRAGFTLQRLGISVPGLSGMFYLERGSFLHLGVSLKYAPATGGPTYELAELRRVLAYPEFGLAPAAQQSILDQYQDVAERFDVGSFCRKLPRCRDPDDQPFLVLAAAGGADLLVSKDRALLEMNRHGGLGFAIVSPDGACRRLGLQADPGCHIGVNRV